MPQVRLDVTDAGELAEMPRFLSGWLDRDPARLGASLEEFADHPAYGITQLHQDLERFVFPLGGSDGEPLFGPALRPARSSRPAKDTPGLPGLNVVRPRAARCGRSTLTPATAPAVMGAHPGETRHRFDQSGRPARNGSQSGFPASSARDRRACSFPAAARSRS